jgi:type I restriction enzyme R subunit
VVDHISIEKQIKHYSKADSGNIGEIEASIFVVRDHLDLLARIFHQFDTATDFKGSPVEQLRCLNLATEYVQLTELLSHVSFGSVPL